MVGQALGAYRIESELGSGGMGKVYLATKGEDRFALKVVHPHLLSEPGFFKRFLREAEIGKTVDHPNVVRCYDCDQLIIDNTTHAFLVMEYVEGQTLCDLLAELETVPEELCRHIGREVSKGLAAIHEVGVVHRDLKPENVLITPDHEIKIMDLGVARLADEAIRLSMTGAFVGSPLYASPEQFSGEELDGASDLFSLGVILYELSCGAHPHPGDNFMQVLARVVEDEPRRLGDRNPQLSAFFEEVVHALLLKDREERFTSASRLREVLEQGEKSTWWDHRARTLRAETKLPIRRIRIPRETEVYGREAELARLRGAYEKVKSGDGQVALIEGEAGIGKSRLIDEFIAGLHRDGEDLNFLFGSYPPGGAATASGAWSTAYREHFGAEGLAETLEDYLTVTPILVPAFAALLRGEPPPEGKEPLTKDSVQTVFVHATSALARERTTVVLIEDLHFAPEEGRAIFASLAHAAPGHRILLVGTTRPGLPEDWRANLERLDQTSRLELARLGPKDLTKLLIDAFQSEKLAEELAFKIALKSDGNPFFVFEIIRGLREGQFITKHPDGTWVTTKVIQEIEIPSSVLDLVNARVADLSEEERDLLDVACCWGFEFDPGLIGEVLDFGRIPTLKRFGRIERTHRLVRSSGRTYSFDHHQVQEALYGSLHEQMREEYHGALAVALEARSRATEGDAESLDGDLCVDLCRHFLEGARGEMTLRYLPAALTHLESGYLHAPTVDLAERALAVPGLLPDIERAKLLLRLGTVNGPLDRMGRRVRQEEVAREAERLAEEVGDDALRSQAAIALGWALWRSSRHEEAEAAFRSAIEIANAAGEQRTEAHATGNLGVVLYSQGRLEKAREHYERNLALSREIGDRQGEARATGNLGVVFKVQGRLEKAREHYERHLALSRELGNRLGEATATGNLGNVFKAEGRLAEAREHHERHLALSREIGYRQGEAHATGNLAGVFRAEGRLTEAQEHYDRHLALSCEIGDRRGEAIATGNLGNLFCSQGHLARAREHFERSLALSGGIGHRRGEAFAQHNLGNVLREQGEPVKAEERLEACLALCEEIGLRELAALTHLVLGSLQAASSDGPAGRRSLETARDLAAQIGVAGVVTLAHCELALLPGGDAEDALRTFTENEERLSTEEHREARYLLWKATGDGTYIEEAKRLLDESVAHVPDDIRKSMLQNLRVNREIMAAWEDRQASS